MVKFFSWTIVTCILLIILNSLLITFISENISLIIIQLLFWIGTLSSIGLIITLILERIKDRKEEKHDISKY